MSSPSQPDEPRGEVDVSAELLQPNEVDFAAVARVSTQAALKNIRLKFLHADFTEADGAIPSDWTEHAVMGLSTAAQLDRSTGALLVECAFLAMYAPNRGDASSDAAEIPDPADAPVELHARFQLLYQLPDTDQIQDRDPEHFALANGVLHAWPYWRELAQTTTARMGLTPLLIETVKLPWIGDPKRQKLQSDADS